jgi:hypothetical protein
MMLMDDRLLSHLIRVHVLDASRLPQLLRTVRGALFPNNMPGKPTLFPPANDSELRALRRRCASAVWALVPKAAGRLFFSPSGGDAGLGGGSGDGGGGGGHLFGFGLGAPGADGAVNPVSTPRRQKTEASTELNQGRGKESGIARSAPRSPHDNLASAAAGPVPSTSQQFQARPGSGSGSGWSSPRSSSRRSAPEPRRPNAGSGVDAAAISTSTTSSTNDSGAAAGGTTGGQQGEEALRQRGHLQQSNPNKRAASKKLSAADADNNNNNSSSEPRSEENANASTNTDNDQQPYLDELDRSILAPFSDAYCNKHLVYGILELLLVRLLPEMGEKGVRELWEERGVFLP